jgi:hypothetical protein
VTTEALALLVPLLRDWRVAPILAHGETTATWRMRVLQGRLRGLAFGIEDAPLTFVRRS